MQLLIRSSFSSCSRERLRSRKLGWPEAVTLLAVLGLATVALLLNRG